MASKNPQLQSKVQPVAANNGASYYRLLLEQNKRYIQDPPTIEKCQSLAKQLFYTRLASIPHRYNSFWKELDHAKNLVKNSYTWKKLVLLLCLDWTVLHGFGEVRL